MLVIWPFWSTKFGIQEEHPYLLLDTNLVCFLYKMECVKVFDEIISSQVIDILNPGHN